MNGKKNWRLSKTLKRNVEIRPIEQADVKYAWGAYKKGALKPMGTPFDGDELDAPTFKDRFEEYVLANATACWTVIANAKIGRAPIGFVFGVHTPAGIMILGIVWFPWATKRNIVEGTVCFFHKLRDDPWMGFATKEHKPVYEVCMRHGVMRQIGTSIRNGQSVAVYEGRH